MTVFSVEIVSWADYGETLQRIRDIVFIDEQNVPPELEYDDHDVNYVHALAFDGRKNPVGAGRLLDDGMIGRMAVLKEGRGLGIGRAILLALVNEARKKGLPEVQLNSQVHAIGFYEANGFIAEGDEFMDAGMPHRRMVRPLPRTNTPSNDDSCA